MCLSSDMVRSGFGSYCRIGNRFAFPFLTSCLRQKKHVIYDRISKKKLTSFNKTSCQRHATSKNAGTNCTQEPDVTIQQCSNFEQSVQKLRE